MVRVAVEPGRESGKPPFKERIDDSGCELDVCALGIFRSLGTIHSDVQELSRVCSELLSHAGSAGEIEQSLEVLVAQMVDRIALEAQRHEHACYRQLFESRVIGFCTVDNAGAVVEANDYYLEWLGRGREELTAGKLRWDELIAPDFRSQAQQAFAEVMSRGSSAPFEAQYIHCRGHRVWGLVGAALLERTVPETAVCFVLDTTDDQQARSRLRESEERYRQLLETAEEGVWLIDAEARTLYVNSKMADILGCAVSEVVGRSLFAFMDADAQGTARELFARRRQGVRERHRFTFRGRNRTEVVTSLATSPVFDSDGRFAGALALVTDITEQQRSLDRLRTNESRLNLALTASRQGLWDWNLVNEETHLSPIYWEMTGYREGEVRPDLAWFYSIVHPDDRVMVETSMQEHLQGNSPQSVIEYRMKTKTGEYVWIRGVGRVTERDDNGAPLRMVGVIQDITERKRIEEEQRFLARAGALLSSSLDYEHTLSTLATMAVGEFADWCCVDLVDEQEGLMRLKVVGADPTTAALCARLEQLPSDRWQHHLARAVVEMRRPILLEHVTLRDIESYAQGPDHLEALLAVGARSAIAVPLIRQDQTFGVLVFVSSTPSRIYGDADVRFATALADRAALALENARLYRVSVQATQLRDQVLGIVAHDLRNPLSTILLQTAMLENCGATPAEPLRKARDGIYRAASHMNRLIQDLLDVALTEVGELRIEQAPLSPETLVAEVAKTQEERATACSVELRLDVEDGVPEVLGDYDRLVQVFENLIGNAIKFTAAGGRITVGAASKHHDVVFWVADTGCGIAPEALSHVFDRFWQATRADRQGAGLGLYITRSIVEAHRGRIWVESTLGRGTTFFFALPGRRQEPSSLMSSFTEGPRSRS